MLLEPRLLTTFTVQWNKYTHFAHSPKFVFKSPFYLVHDPTIGIEPPLDPVNLPKFAIEPPLYRTHGTTFAIAPLLPPTPYISLIALLAAPLAAPLPRCTPLPSYIHSRECIKPFTISISKV